MFQLRVVAAAIVLGVALHLPGASGAESLPRSGPREELEAILAPDLKTPRPGARISRPGAPGEVRGDRALRVLERAEGGARAREADGWFLERYTEALSEDYYYAACTAALHLGEVARRAALTDAERRVLQQLADPVKGGSLPGMARAALLEDRLRGRPEAECIPVYREGWGGSSWIPHGSLLLLRFQIPEPLNERWKRGERFEKYGKFAYQGRAGEHYFRFRGMKFPSVPAEMAFLWERILAQYERSAHPGQGPDDLELYQFQEARAATARLIEIGAPAVRFLLERKNEILKATDPKDPRATVGDIYELWVARALLDPAFKPVLQQLEGCGNPKVERAARETREGMERDDPYPYRAGFVFGFRRQMGG